MTNKSPNEIWGLMDAKIERVTEPKHHRVITLPNGASFCPVACTDDYLHTAEIQLGLELLKEGL